MKLNIEVTYDKPLARRGIRKFMLHELNGTTYAILVIIGLFLLVSYFKNWWENYTTLLCFLYALLVVTLIYVYLIRLSQSNAFFKKCKSPSIRFAFTNEAVEIEYDLGTSHMKWEAFDKIIQYSDMWLLVYQKSGYLLIPEDKLSKELKELLQSKIPTSLG